MKNTLIKLTFVVCLIAAVLIKIYLNEAEINKVRSNIHKKILNQLKVLSSGKACDLSNPIGIENVNGVEVKIYKQPNGQELYIGPPGAGLISGSDGKPTSAYVYDKDGAMKLDEFRRKQISDLRAAIENENNRKK